MEAGGSGGGWGVGSGEAVVGEEEGDGRGAVEEVVVDDVAELEGQMENRNGHLVDWNLMKIDSGKRRNGDICRFWL